MASLQVEQNRYCMTKYGDDEIGPLHCCVETHMQDGYSEMRKKELYNTAIVLTNPSAQLPMERVWQSCRTAVSG